MCFNINEVEVKGEMTLSQASILHYMAVTATVVLLVLVVGIELNPGLVRGRRVLIVLDMAALTLVIVLGAVTHH